MLTRKKEFTSLGEGEGDRATDICGEEGRERGKSI